MERTNVYIKYDEIKMMMECKTLKLWALRNLSSWVWHWSQNVDRVPSSTCSLVANSKQVHFQQRLSSSHSAITARCVEHTANSRPVDGFCPLSCGSLRLLKSSCGPLGCFSDFSSPCPTSMFGWSGFAFCFYNGPWEVQRLGYFV